MEIAIDFDGTVVTHSYPEIGADIGAAPVLQEVTAAGHRLILWTMRSDDKLVEAIQWFMDNNIPLYGIQCNPTQRAWTTSPKCYAPLYIDDAALGAPLKFDKNLSGRPFIDWTKTRKMLLKAGILPPLKP